MHHQTSLLRGLPAHYPQRLKLPEKLLLTAATYARVHAAGHRTMQSSPPRSAATAPTRRTTPALPRQHPSAQPLPRLTPAAVSPVAKTTSTVLISPLDRVGMTKMPQRMMTQPSVTQTLAIQMMVATQKRVTRRMMTQPLGSGPLLCRMP